MQYEYRNIRCITLENRIEKYEQQITQLTNNWNELEEYIAKEWYCFDNESVECMVARDILDKMKEIKEGKNENK